MRSDGQGSWIRYRPFTDCGWLVYVQDENVYYSFQGSAWASLSNATAPGTSVLKHAVFEHIETAGTNGGGSSATAWTDRTLNTDTVNTITGCTRSTNEITLPAGTYLVIFWSMIYLAGAGLKAWTRLKSTTTSQEVMSFTEVSDASGAPIRCFGHGIITLATQEIMAFDYYANTAQASSGLGLAANLGSESERFARVEIIDLTSIQGPTGATGPQGTVVNNSYTVAALPSGTAGQVAYASNGRKNGEGGGSGTGVLVFHDGTAWRACDTGATVAA
jgi:hypothetical protein